MLIYNCQEEIRKKDGTKKMMYDYEISIASQCGASLEDMLAISGISMEEWFDEEDE